MNGTLDDAVKLDTRLCTYMDIADETTAPDALCGVDGFAKRYVTEATDVAAELGLPWPPAPTWEDDVRDVIVRMTRGARR